MPKGSASLTNARREEILAACEKLYRTMSIKDITLIHLCAHPLLPSPAAGRWTGHTG